MTTAGLYLTVLSFMRSYCTVTIENAAKHADDSSTRNRPHSRIFQHSSRACMYLHKEIGN
jgi:hypothetical protein